MFRRLQVLKCVHQLHTTSFVATVDKSLLSKLRKKTGFPFINCKKALEKFNNDIVKAEAWMKEEAQKEGWAKASKLQGRPMSQGLVGLIRENNIAAMVEVNCETDFVARNTKFRDLVAKITSICLHEGQKSDTVKVDWAAEDLNKITTDDGKTVADLIAMNVGNIGENLAVRRGVFMTGHHGAFLGHYVHSSGDTPKDKYCLMGRFGALVGVEKTPVSENLSKQDMDDIGRQLCQHIVGMNPKSLGNLEDDVANEDKDGETKLMFQEYLLDPTMTVREYLASKGVNLVDFVRLECGEELDESKDLESKSM